MVSGVSSLCQMVSRGCLCGERYFQGVLILTSVLFVLYRRPSWSSGKTFAANAGGRGFESHRGQNLFVFHNLLYFIVEGEKLLLKSIKIN